MDCDPNLADTAVFCEHYGIAPEISANTILVRSKTGEEKFAACLVLATTRLDVNKVVRKKLGARKVSFAGPEETKTLTGMEIGGVTPVGLPDELPLWVDGRIMDARQSRSSAAVIGPTRLLSIPPFSRPRQTRKSSPSWRKHAPT